MRVKGDSEVEASKDREELLELTRHRGDPIWSMPSFFTIFIQSPIKFTAYALRYFGGTLLFEFANF